MKTKTLITLLFIISSCFLTQVQAQEQCECKRTSAIYFEGFGNNLYYGLFYDSRFGNSDKGLGGSIGFGAYKNQEFVLDYYNNSTSETVYKLQKSNFLGTSLQINYLWGKGPHNMEVGAGATYFAAKNFGYGFVRGDQSQFSSIFGSLSMMYRFHLPRSLFLRVGWTPFFGMANDGFVFIPYQFGFGLGYAFK